MATSPQKVVRGTSVLFQELFIEEDGTPLLPSDPSAYPSLSIMSPTEEAIQTGVATQVPASPGRWQFSWFVPADAELSTSDTPWQIELTSSYAIILKLLLTRDSTSTLLSVDNLSGPSSSSRTDKIASRYP